MSDEEYEGVTLTVSATEWPKGLSGLVINKQNVYVENGVVKIIGDPIWSVEANPDEL
jgi:hypothetical protein